MEQGGGGRESGQQAGQSLCRRDGSNRLSLKGEGVSNPNHPGNVRIQELV